MDVREAVQSLGGCAHTQSLRSLGVREIELTRAVRSGDVLRARRGWYVSWEDKDPATLAIRAGGRLTGISAVQHWGGWVLGPRELHVSVPDNSARNRHRRGRARLHWDARDVAERGTPSCVGVADALVRVALDEPFESAVAAMDWALHTGRIDRVDLERAFDGLPPRCSHLLGATDPYCESLPESLARVRLRRLGYAVASQIPLGRGRIDLVVNGVIALETDGDEFHRDAFEQDRRKDLAMILAGYHPVRVPARVVFSEWDAVVRAIAAVVGRCAPLALATQEGCPPKGSGRPNHGKRRHAS